MATYPRRRFIASSGIAAGALLAGCTGGGDGGDSTGGSNGGGSNGGATNQGGSNGGGSGDSPEYVITAGSPPTMNFAMANQIGSMMSQESDHNVHPEPGSSTRAGTAKLVQGNTDIAVSTAYNLYLALEEGEDIFGTTDWPDPPMAVTSYFTNGMGLLVKTESDDQYISDLAGKSFGVGPQGVGFWPPYKASILHALGEDEINLKYNEFDEFSSVLANDRFHAAGGALDSNGVQPGPFTQLIASADVRLLGMREEMIESIQSDPGIDGRMYSHDRETLSDINEYTMDGETFLPTNRVLLSSTRRVPEETIYEFVKTLWKNREALGEAHAGFLPYAEDDFWTSNIIPEVPVHPGAARFYREAGIWDESLTVGSME